MKNITFLLLACLLIINFSCTQDSSQEELFIDSIEIESRKSCEGCTISLSQNGCSINVTIGEGCSEISRVEWGYPPPDWAPAGTGPTWHPGSINGITASPKGGTYCIRIQFVGCPQPVEECITIKPGCDELCEGCTVDFTASEEDCTLTAEVGNGCTKPVELEWYVDGVTSSGPVAPYANGGEYCLTVTDANGCEARRCKHIERCDPCSENICEVSIVPDYENCILSAKVSDDCVHPLEYEWYVDGQTTFESTAPFATGGTYSLIVTDANGCTTRVLDTFESCEVECEPEWYYSSHWSNLRFRCHHISGKPVISQSVDLAYDCNTCCKDLEINDIDYTMEFFVENISKGIVYIDWMDEYTQSNCWHMGNGFTQNLECLDISVGDAIGYSWTIEITGQEGCEFIGDLFYEGSETYTVTAEDIEDCCQ